MTPYSHYAAKPQPCPVPLAVVLFGGVIHSTANARRVTFARDSIEDFSTAKPHKDKPVPLPREKKQSAFERYSAILSKRKWISSSEIADDLLTSREAVNKFLSSHREKLHKRQENSGKGYLINYWKLK